MALLQVDGIDWQYGRLHFPSDETLERAAKDFRKHMKREREHIRECCRMLKQTSDPEMREAYRIAVHGVKGGAAAIGAVTLSGLARTLELAAKRQDDDLIFAVMPAFEWEVQNLLNGMNEIWRAEDEAAAETSVQGTPVSYDEVAPVLKGLREAFDQLDLKRLDELVETLRAYSFPQEASAYMEALEAAAEELEDEEGARAIDALEQYLKQ